MVVSEQLAKKKVCIASILWCRGKTLEECWNTIPYAHWLISLIVEFKMLDHRKINHILSLMIVFIEDAEVNDFLHLVKSGEHNFCINELRLIFTKNETFNHVAKAVIRSYTNFDNLSNKELKI